MSRLLEPPADLPEKQKAIYQLAAEPVSIAVEVCSSPQRFTWTPDVLSLSLRPLTIARQSLSDWMNGEEGKLLAEAPKVFEVLGRIVDRLEQLDSRVRASCVMTGPVGLPPGMHGSFTPSFQLCADDVLNDVPALRGLLDELRSALSVWANPHAPDVATQAPGAQWLTVKDAATASGCTRGEISHAVDHGSLKSNGKKGRQRRIDAADLTLWQLRRANRKESVESDETVRRKFRSI